MPKKEMKHSTGEQQKTANGSNKPKKKDPKKKEPEKKNGVWIGSLMFVGLVFFIIILNNPHYLQAQYYRDLWEVDLQDEQLLTAVKQNDLSLAQKLLANGANPNTAQDDLFQRFALGIAVDRNDLEMVKLLLSYHANPNQGDQDGRTPLMTAIDNGQQKIAEVLLESGAKLEQKDDYGQNVLHYSTRQSNLLLVKWLLHEKKLYIDEPDYRGRTPLHNALILNQNPEMISLLLDKGADVLKADLDQMSPIETIMMNKDVKLFRNILDRQPSLLQSKLKDEPLLFFVSRRNAPELLEELVKRGVDLNQKNASGETALHIAAFSHYPKLIEELLRLKADSTILNQLKETPYQISKQFGDQDSMIIFEKYGVTQ